MKFELKRPYKHFTDRELLDDLRRVAAATGRTTVTKSNYAAHGRFSRRTISDRFGSWVRALEQAGLGTDHARAATHEELIADLRRVAETFGRAYVSISEYQERGKWSEGPFFRAFGNWSKALAAAGLARHPNSPGRASEEELLANLEHVWVALGRQPRHSEIRAPLSRFSASTYLNRFGSWRKALESFVAWVETDEPEHPDLPLAESPQPLPSTTDERAIRERRKPRTSRIPNLRLKFRVMRRDRFTCRACGRSPALHPGLVLNIDHVLAWEAGGETIENNLQTLCEDCNQGKGVLNWHREGGL